MENFYKTFHPKVLHGFEHSRRDPRQLKFIRNYGFEEWLRVYGPHVLNKSIINHMILEIRDYESTNGSGRKILFEKCDQKVFKKFLELNNGIDIIDVLGDSIISKTRREISKCGTEFFIVRKEGVKDGVSLNVNMKPEHHLRRERILEKYARKFFKTLVGTIANNISCIKSELDIRKLFEDLERAVNLFLTSSLKNTHVKLKSEGSTKYGIDDVLRIISSQHGDVPGSVKFPLFLSRIKSTIGNEIKNWVKLLPKTWVAVQSQIEKKEGANITLNNEEEKKKQQPNKEEYNLFKKSISSYISPKRPSYVGHLSGLYSGKMNYGTKNVVVESQKRVEKKKSRAELFKDLELKVGCNHCDCIECEKRKNSRIGGILTKFSNPSKSCPKRMFQQRKEEDTKFTTFLNVFTKKVEKESKRIGKKLKKNLGKKSNGIHAVFVLPKDNEFSPKDHVISMKQVKKYEDEKICEKAVNMISKGGQDYKIIGNKLTSNGGKNSFTVVEHKDKDIPGVLFLIESSE